MKRLEIIHLRSSRQPVESLSNRIGESSKAARKDTEVITLYRRHGLETDVAIHIHHLEVSEREGPGSLGLQLASELVEHTV